MSESREIAKKEGMKGRMGESAGRLDFHSVIRAVIKCSHSWTQRSNYRDGKLTRTMRGLQVT